MILFVIILLAFLVPSNVMATNRFLDTTAGACAAPTYSIANRNCTGSDGASYATAASWVASEASGDTLYARTGTYNFEFVNSISSGTAATPTVVSAYNDEVVTFTITAGSGRCVTITNRSYITFRGIVFNCSGSQFDGMKIESSSHHIRLENVEIKNATSNCLLIQNSPNGTLYKSKFYNCGVLTTNLEHGFYLSGTSDDWLIEYSQFYENAGTGLQLYTTPKRTIFRYNKVYNNCRKSASGGQFVVAHQNHSIHHNIIYKTANNCTTGILVNLQSAQNSNLSNNSIYCHTGTCTYGINIGSGVLNTSLINNIILGFTTAINNSGTGTIQTTNRTSGTATSIWTSPSTGNLTLKASSVAIDAGTDIGYPFNGSGADQGAFESFVFSSCEVPSGAGTKIRVTFTNNANPPLLPSSGATTFTARRSGANNPLNGAVVRAGDGILELTLTNTYGGGDTADISGSTWNITDSALIGNDLSQPYLQTLTNQSCTNNVGGISYTLTQARFELHGYRGTEASPLILPHGFASSGAAENYTSYSMVAGGSIRIRFAIVCGVSNCDPTAFHLYYSTGGAYGVVPSSFDSEDIKFCGLLSGSTEPQNGSATTEQLSTSGTFIPGGIVYTANAVPTITGLNTGYKTELEYCVSLDSDASGNFDLRLYTQSGTALDTYTVTPRIVAIPTAAGGSGM